MTKLNIYLVRHGQTYYNIYNKLGVHSQQELISLVNDVIDISKMPDENHGTGKPHPR